MQEKIIVITPEDTFQLKDYNGYRSLEETVNGTISVCDRIEIPVIPTLANGKDKLKVFMYCNDNFHIENKKEFEKINAIASAMTGQELRGNIALVVDEGKGNARGFHYMEEDIGGGEIEEALCECWTVEDTLMKFRNQNSKAIMNLHREYDNNKSKKEMEHYSIR